MFRNYFKIAIRFILNHKKYSLINIVGLSLGFICFLLLNFYVVREKSFDKDLKGVYRLLQIEESVNGNREMATTGPMVGRTIRTDIPSIEAVTQFMELGRLTVGNDPQNRDYEGITTIDSSFFSIFKYEFIEGSPQTIFNQPNTVVLTESLAQKYFAGVSALNKELFTSIQSFVVGAVIEDIPELSHLSFNLLVPEHTAGSYFRWWDNFMSSNWHRNSMVTYAKINPSKEISDLETQITALVEDNWPADEEFNSTFKLQPVVDIHLYPGDVQGEINKAKGNAFYVKVFSWIAILILLVACFNYTGLLNVTFINRTKEIGVRKVIGANQSQLIIQFFIESILMSGTALAIAFIFLFVTGSLIENYLGHSFGTDVLPAHNLILLAAVGITISLVSVAYPTYKISQADPVKSLKKSTNPSSLSLEKAILTFQFLTAISLIACTILFYNQVQYSRNKDLGFEKEGIVTVDINSGILRNRFEAIKAEFNKLPEVQSVCVTSRVPGEWKGFPVVGVDNPLRNDMPSTEMIFMGADADFIQTYDISLLQGSNFANMPSDSSKVFLNQTAIEQLGLSDPIGRYIEVKTINWGGDNNPLETPFRAEIVGVIDDFYFEDFHKMIRPMIIGSWNNPIHNIDYYSLKVNTSDWKNTLASLNAINAEFDPQNPIEYHFLDSQFERFYKADILRSRLLIFFTGIILFITCMGLFAITSYVLENRTKEIGIRKVLGAQIEDLVQLISRDFVKLVIFASVIAIPLSWFVMSKWLEEFAYRIQIHWVIFFYAIITILLLVLFIVSSQTLGTSKSNPINSLRTE